ncbi:TonB-dependent siderophore receptor [uncultured Nostoc sp.]|uniref:TonB-dependent siderophore receptor n=1 Tax=uncultured Nostoc sp. TaxID=340711 RepID=UPI002605AC19|nr:TonB-dependent siderophore receptor [uncultured Nostoc sp.]
MALEKLFVLFRRCLLFTASMVAYTLPVLSQEIPKADRQPLPQQTAANQVEPTQKIYSLSDMQSAFTSATYLLKTPNNQNSVSQINQATTPVVSVTDVKVNTTDKGIEIILVTSSSEKLSVSGKVEGNSYVADIKNAHFQLTSGESFQQSKPSAGIALVTVTNVDTNTVRLTVVGKTGAPVVELFDSQTEGLVFGVTSTATTQQTPGENSAIELEVIAPPDTGYRIPDATTGTRTNTLNRDIPQTVQVVPRAVIEDQADKRVGDVLRNLGIGQNSEPSRLGESVIIRGFDVEASNSLRDGLRDNFTSFIGTPFQNDLANIERVEVLKGPASVLYGNGSPGGVYNLITKQPLSTPYYSIQGNVGSYSLYKSSIDFTGPLTTDKKLLYRFNADYENSGSYINHVYAERTFFAPVISWQPNRDTKLTVSGEYLSSRQAELSPLGLPAIGTILPNPNGKFSPNTYVGDPTQDREKVTVGRVGYKFEHNFSDKWSLYNSLSYAFVERPYTINVTPTSLEADNRTVDRFEQIWGPTSVSNLSQDTHVVGKFNTGSLEHQLLVGVDWYQRIVSPFSFVVRTFPSLDIYNPVYGQTPGDFLDTRKDKERLDDLGIYFQDQLAIAPNLKLVLGGRGDFEDQKIVAATTSDPTSPIERSVTSQSNSAFSPRLGIVYQPIPPVSLYASYSRSFDQALGTDVNNNSFEPTRGTQYEVGVKTDLLNNKLSATLALYQLTQSNIVTTDINNPTYAIQVGEQRSRGVELFFTGELAPGWNIIAAYNYIDGRVTRDNTFKVGSLLANTPENSASLWTTYIIPKGKLQGLGGGLGVFYFGDREGDLTNTYTLPSYVRTDAALYYRHNHFQAALNFQNLFDVLYYGGAYNINRVFRGEPFGVEATLKWQL